MRESRSISMLAELLELERQARVQEKSAYRENSPEAYQNAGESWQIAGESYAEHLQRSKAGYAFSHSAKMALYAGNVEQGAERYSIAGLMYALAEEWDNSATMWLMSANQFEKAHLLPNAADARITAALILTDCERFEDAAKAHLAASKILQLLERYTQAADEYLKAGRLYEKLEQWKAAEQAFKSAAEQYERDHYHHKASKLYGLAAKMSYRTISPVKPPETKPVPPISSPKTIETTQTYYPPSKAPSGYGFPALWRYMQEHIYPITASAVIVLLFFMLPLTINWFHYFETSAEIEDTAANAPEAEVMPPAPLITDTNVSKHDAPSPVSPPIKRTQPQTNQTVDSDITTASKAPEREFLASAKRVTTEEQIIIPDEVDKSIPPRMPRKYQSRVYEPDDPRTIWYKQRVAAYEAILLRHPTDVAAHKELAIALCALAQPEKAEEHFLAALKFSPTDADIYYQRALCRVKCGHKQRAIEDLRIADQLAPNRLDVLLELGSIYATTDCPSLAIIVYKQALSAHPTSPELHKRLGSLYETQQKYNDALYHFQQARQLAPQDVTVHTALERVYRALGDQQNALAQQQIVQHLLEGTSQP